MAQIIVESPEILGPGFFMFFHELAVFPSVSKTAFIREKSSQNKIKAFNEMELIKLGLEEEDIMELIELTILSGIID